MLKNKTVNIKVVEKVAISLEELGLADFIKSH